MAQSTHWQDLAHGYDNIMYHDPTMSALLETIVKELPPRPRAILDLGTGTGVLLEMIRRRHPKSLLVGLDPAPAMLEQARERTKADEHTAFILGSAHRIDAADASFDAVVSNFALHHLSHPQKQDCAHEVFRVLVPGGYFVYGDQHCRKMGAPDDPDWVEDMFDLFANKARYYLRASGLDRMILQVSLLPRFLLADGEIPATVDYWQQCLSHAGFLPARVITLEPEFLHHNVIVAAKPGGGHDTN